jgi:hypothetical protein
MEFEDRRGGDDGSIKDDQRTVWRTFIALMRVAVPPFSFQNGAIKVISSDQINFRNL